MAIEYNGISIEICEDVYEPAEDTYLLAESIDFADSGRVLEMGCGSGIISILAAKSGASNVVSADINPKAVICTRENARRNKIKNLEAIESDLFSSIEGKFDLIIFNTPYLPSEEGYESSMYDRSWDGGKDAREVIERFIADAPNHLTGKGRIVMLESTLSHYEKTLEHFDSIGFSVKVIASLKLDWEEIVVIEANS